MSQCCWMRSCNFSFRICKSRVLIILNLLGMVPHYARKGKLVVGNDLVLRKELFDHFHATSVGGHSGVHATRHKLASMLYWMGLARDVKL